MGGWGRALGTAIPQALSDITSMQNLALREKEEQRAEETHQITMAEQKREAEKAAQEEKRLDSTMDITVHPMFLALPQDQQPKILDFFAKNKLTDTSGKGSIRNIMTGVKMLEGSKSLFTEFMAPVVEGKKQTYLQRNAELQELTAKGDAKKVQELTPIVNQLRTDYLGSLNNFGDHVAKLEEIEAEKETKEQVLPYKIGERHKFTGKDGKEYEGTFAGLGTDNEPKWGNVVKVSEKPLAGERQTPSQQWGVLSKIEDDARAYANVTVPKAANQISIGADGKIILGGQIADEDVKKWVNAYQNHYSRKVNEAKGMGALPSSYKSKPVIEKESLGGIQERFNSDTSMKGNKLGKQTPKGYEVYKGNKLVGYYQ